MGVTALVALFGIGMCAFLNYFKFRSALETAAASSMAVPASSVREGLEASLALGLPLNGANEAPALLAREKLADPAIAEISVFDEQGRILFSTEAGRVGAQLESNWLQRAQSSSGRWQLGLEDQAVLGLPLHNSFDLRLGEVAVRYSLASSERALGDMREQLLLVSLAGWGLTLMLAGAGVAMVQRWSGAALTRQPQP
ncbi:MAG TPA: hypothetical protein VGM81_23660 [Burkholderiaceae bacterium]|jgi:hypothetical protein